MFPYRLSIGVLVLSSLLSLPAIAQCDLHKAARNAALDKTIGISGKCDARRATTQNIDAKLGVSDKTENVKQRATNTKNKVKTAQDAIKK